MKGDNPPVMGGDGKSISKSTFIIQTLGVCNELGNGFSIISLDPKMKEWEIKAIGTGISLDISKGEIEIGVSLLGFGAVINKTGIVDADLTFDLILLGPVSFISWSWKDFATNFWENNLSNPDNFFNDLNKLFER